MLRHLPPTATPISLRTVSGALRPKPDAVERFERQFSAYQGVNTSYTAASGRTALHLLLTALTRSMDDRRREVIMPAYTCPSLAKVTLAIGLQPRLVDMNIASFGFDKAALEVALGPQTLAVMHVHPFGIPVEVASILPLVEQHGAVLIEDAAQSMGARLHGRPVGSLGHFGLYSLGPGKPISAGGGGIVTINQEDAFAAINHNWEELPTSAAPSSALAVLRLAAFSAAFHPLGWWLATRAGAHKVGNHEAAQGYAMAPLSAAQATVAASQIIRLDGINQARRRRAAKLLAYLSRHQELTFPGIDLTSGDAIWQPLAAEAEPIFLRLPLLASNTAQRDRLFDALWSAGIGVGKMYQKPLTAAFPQLASYSCPNAEQIADRLLTLPTHHYLTDADMQRIRDVVDQILPD